MESQKTNTGIQNLLDFYRSVFEIPENINFYEPEDFKAAERKFLKFCLHKGGYPPGPH